MNVNEFMAKNVKIAKQADGTYTVTYRENGVLHDWECNDKKAVNNILDNFRKLAKNYLATKEKA